VIPVTCSNRFRPSGLPPFADAVSLIASRISSRFTAPPRGVSVISLLTFMSADYRTHR
jgi:hypothetical protein